MRKFGSTHTALSQSGLQGVLAKALLPFAVPILLTFALVLVIGDQWPRDIAPGSGLKLAGLGATALTALVVWRNAITGAQHDNIRKLAALLCVVTGVMGWPVWSVGVLPSINGAMLHNQSTIRMTLERTEVTHKSKSRDLYYWAWLKAEHGDPVIESGRYFIPKDFYERLAMESPPAVDVSVAQGLLGAQVIIKFE